MKRYSKEHQFIDRVAAQIVRRETATEKKGLVTFVDYKAMPINMLKLLLTGTLVYFIYRFFIAPPAVGQGQNYNDEPIQQSRSDQHDDEYVDYEEVD